MERYKLFIKEKLRSFILIIVDKLIWVSGLSKVVFHSYNNFKVDERCKLYRDNKNIHQYYFSTLKTVRLSEIYCCFNKNAYPDVKKTWDKNYPWDKLEESIRKHGIHKPLQVHDTYRHRKNCKLPRYTLKDGHHRYVIWSYLHGYKDPYIKIYVVVPFIEAKVKEILDPWKYPNLISILFNSRNEEFLKNKNKNIKKIMKKRKKEMQNKTYEPDTDR